MRATTSDAECSSRTRVVAIVVALALVCMVAACKPPCPEDAGVNAVPVPEEGIEATCAESRLSAKELNDLAVAAFRTGNLELGYRDLALIHLQYPGSKEDREAFPLAVRVFRRLFLQHRTEVKGPWRFTQPHFMFEWLAQYFDGQDEFPQSQVDLFFLGMPGRIFHEFIAWSTKHAQEQPALARWKITHETDDGIIQAIEGTREGA